MNKANLKHGLQLQSRRHLLSFFFLLCCGFGFGQVKATVDSTTIKIGEQILYKIAVEADTTDLVKFPEGQTFLPLEMVEALDTDTTNENAKYRLIKQYRLTQFDSGSYTIPPQKITIGLQSIFTDSLRVEVTDVEVDTTKQKLYDIKPIIEVKKGIGNWWKYLLLGLLILGLIAFLVYWFVWREKPLTEEEEIALLPPYDRAKLALKALDEAKFLEKDQIKAYYTELTMIIRKYIDEKVYDHALESTTDELISRLQLLKDGNQIDFDKETIRNIETIFKRADLVKFAKSKPDVELAKIDRNTIDLEIDHVKDSLPEPTEEELLQDKLYQEELARKKKRRQIIITTVIGVLIFIGTIAGFVIHYGFNYVKDTIIGHASKELLETKDWVMSEYGAPPVIISTPRVLERQDPPELPEELEENIRMAVFSYGSLQENLQIAVSTARYNPEMLNGEPIDLRISVDGSIAEWEKLGVQNIITRAEQFITPNGQEGLKAHGTADFPDITGQMYDGNYVILVFTKENILHQIILTWEQDDEYADQIMERVLNSIELLKIEEEPEEPNKN